MPLIHRTMNTDFSRETPAESRPLNHRTQLSIKKIIPTVILSLSSGNDTVKQCRIAAKVMQYHCKRNTALLQRERCVTAKAMQ